MKKLKKIIAIVFWITMVFTVYYIVSNIVGSFIYFTSFPWWSAFVFAAIYFGPLLTVEGIAYFAVCFLQKRKGAKNG